MGAVQKERRRPGQAPAGGVCAPVAANCWWRQSAEARRAGVQPRLWDISLQRGLLIYPVSDHLPVDKTPRKTPRPPCLESRGLSLKQ